VVGVAGVDAADERVDQALGHLVAEAAPHQGADGDVALGRVEGDGEVLGRSGQALRGHDARGGQLVEVGGDAEHLRLGQQPQRAPAPHVSPSRGGGHQVAVDAEGPAELDALGHAGQERVGGLVEGAAVERGRAQLAARGSGVDDDDRGPADGQLAGGHEPGDPGADDDRVDAHDGEASARTRSASARRTVGSSLSTRVRAKASPACSARRAASTSRS
jgi:hypothetical protein